MTATSPADTLRGDLVRLAWRQWTALGVTGWSEADERPVDPEALIVLTARIGESDARLRDAATDWCVEAGHLINGSRLGQVVREIGGDDPLVSRFFATVKAAGGPAWVKSEAEPRPGYVNRHKVHLTHLASPGRLVLRLRALLGVNARADIVAMLMGVEEPIAIADVARQTRFTRTNVDKAVAALALGGLVRVVERGARDTRVQLSLDAPLVEWLAVSQPVADWVSRFNVALQILELLDRVGSSPRAALGVEARRLLATIAPVLSRAMLTAPDERLIADAYLDSLDRWLGSLGSQLMARSGSSSAGRSRSFAPGRRRRGPCSPDGR